jgi:hypothetical protein
MSMEMTSDHRRAGLDADRTGLRLAASHVLTFMHDVQRAGGQCDSDCGLARGGVGLGGSAGPGGNRNGETS